MYQEKAPNRHVPVNTNQGWGIAGLIILLAIAFNAWSTWVHFTEYRDPRDPSWSYRGPEGAAQHGPAAGERGAAPAGGGEHGAAH